MTARKARLRTVEGRLVVLVAILALVAGAAWLLRAPPPEPDPYAIEFFRIQDEMVRDLEEGATQERFARRYHKPMSSDNLADGQVRLNYPQLSVTFDGTGRFVGKTYRSME